VIADIDAGTLARRLMDPAWRLALSRAMAAEEGTRLPITHAFQTTVPSMVATVAEVRAIVIAAQADGCDNVLQDLLFHPNVPEDVLIGFCERGEFIQTLGHRAGPRSLLVRVAELHGYPEAIISLGQLERARASDPAKEAAYARIAAGRTWRVSRRKVSGRRPASD
jgi:hypothetical protein